MRRIVITLGLVALGTQGCSGNDDGSDPTDTDGTTITDCDDSLNPQFTPSQVAGAGTVSFTGGSGEAWVEHRLDEDGTAWIADARVDAASGSAPVYGLRVGSTHKVVVKVDGGQRTSCPITVETDPPPAGTPAFTPVDPANWATDKACPGTESGYVLLSYLGQGKSGVGIVDRDGKYVWAVANDPSKPWGAGGTLIGRARLGRDGRSILWNTAHEDRVEDVGEIIRVGIDGSETTRTRTMNAHHDFVELPDGTMAWLGYDFRTTDVEGIGTGLEVAADVIYETQEGAPSDTPPTTVYNLFDHYPYGVYDSGSEMRNCTTGFLPGYCEFSHGNSLAYLPGSDTYLAGFRWLDAIVKVSRSGDLVWQFGGIHESMAVPSDFTGDESTLHNHSHFSDAWESAGRTHLVMMDNHDIDPPSRLAGYSLDESAMTFERDFFWESDKFESLLGDVRRMPIEGCDNVLVAFSSQGRIAEMTRDGEIVWDMGYGLGNVVARVQYLPSLTDFGDYAYWQTEL